MDGDEGSSSSGMDSEDDNAPVGSLQNKWRLLPHFLAMRGLMKQHIDSFNYFVQTDIKNIVNAASNREVKSDVDPRWYKTALLQILFARNYFFL